MRKLASIQRIKSLEPIEGADAIEKATVLGWQLVVKKGEYQMGDLAVYCEIDSILPDRPEFEFLKPRGMRIRTIRLRGQVSQGICFPLSILPDHIEVQEDLDVTEILGITKYEPPIPAYLSGKVKGKFPSFIPKTDETRVQILQKVLDKYQGVSCYVSEKLDGSSATYFIKDGEFGVCSRNMELYEDDENSFWKVARELNVEEKLRSLNKNIAIQGELIGEGIQDNKLRLRGQTVRIFNAFDIDRFEYLPYQEFLDLMEKLDLPIVPIMEADYKLENDIEAIVKKATVRSLICKDVWAEGIVIRPHLEKMDLLLSIESFNTGRVSFKAINPEFLIKYGE
ncbi:RNA ligase, DRB0094 family [Aquiflexum balticum DSM 16537]|uniref:RNA ligase, DRB0094 family n=1 Tax=Aquiflexum balticum DSM 16537 TaxID=758820 RepID=A0A1W2GZQ8_9BACT|nr:RNA ligase (ATP) [Aquiflexum balticum]SMD42170.1 RNA ligase, DRB0094 family [Aquiflexum balticum DSM 16537]